MTVNVLHFSPRGCIRAFEQAGRSFITPVQHWLQVWRQHWLEASSATHICCGQITVLSSFTKSSTSRLLFVSAVGLTSIEPLVERQPLGLPVPFEFLSLRTLKPEKLLGYFRAQTAEIKTHLAIASFFQETVQSFERTNGNHFSRGIFGGILHVRLSSSD